MEPNESYNNYAEIAKKFSTFDSDVQNLGKLITRLKKVRKNSHAIDSLQDGEFIDEAVFKYFPYPFKAKYNNWDKASTDFYNTLEDFPTDIDRIEKKFKIYSNQVIEVWDIVIGFTPIFLMLMLNRMKYNIIREYAYNELSIAIEKYWEIYLKSANSKNIGGGKQNELIEKILNVFYKLSEQGVLGQDFVLYSILPKNDMHQGLEKKGFVHLFPKRFKINLEFLVRFRNQIIHKNLANKTDILVDLYSVVEDTMYDTINSYVKIFTEFDLVNVTGIDLSWVGKYLIKGVSLSGTRGEVEYRIKTDYNTGKSKIEENGLYLIKRTMRNSKRDTGKTLSPDDYINLTPLLIFYTESAIIPRNTKELFVFKSFEINKNKIIFKQFAGASNIDFYNQGQSESKIIIYKNIEIYIKEESLFSLTALNQLASITKKKIQTPDYIKEKLLQISQENMSQLVRFSVTDRNPPSDNLQHLKFNYNAQLFTSPEELQTLNHFIQSDKQGIIFTGRSGMGKSNLLIHKFLEMRESKQLILFLNSCQFVTAEISNQLTNLFFTRVDSNIKTLNDIGNYLNKNKLDFLIFIDAINEYNNEGGPILLLKNIIDFVTDSHRIRIIASCRIEIWNEYIRKNNRYLDSQYFYTNSAGAPITVTPFNSQEKRQELYEKYQNFYKLLPESFLALNHQAKELIKEPFMMELVAETYSNINTSEKKFIRGSIDYFEIFQKLTQRKIGDIKILINPTGIKDEFIEKDVMDCLYRFAELVYTKITQHKYSNIDRTDSLTQEILRTDNVFKPYLDQFSQNNKISIFDTLIQVGIIERVHIEGKDYWGEIIKIKAYRFFHDQYTHYWLSAVLRRKILGTIDNTKILQQKKATLISLNVEELITNTATPLIFGACEHWLYTNIKSDSRFLQNKFILSLFDQLSKVKSGATSYLVGSFIFGLIEKSIYSPDILFSIYIKHGNKYLKQNIINHIIFLWPNIDTDTLKYIIKYLEDHQDDNSLRMLADRLSELYAFYPNKVINLIAKSTYGINKIALSGLRGVFERETLGKHITLIAKFTIKAILNNFDSPEKMLILKEFYTERFKLITDSIKSKGAPKQWRTPLKTILYNKLEEAGLNQWNQAIGSQGNNNYFFLEKNGLVQRDILFKYYKYIIALHNEDYKTVSLTDNSEFLLLSLQMLTYQTRSIITYIAIMTLAWTLSEKPNFIDFVINKIINLNTESYETNLTILLTSIVRLNPSLAEKILKIFQKNILIKILKTDNEYINITGFIGIVAVDVEQHTKSMINSLEIIIEHLTKTENKDGISKFILQLDSSIFHQNPEIGKAIIELFIKKNLQDTPLWKNSTLILMAGMLAKNPILLEKILEKENIDMNIIMSIRQRLSGDMKTQHDKLSYQASWDKFIASSLKSKKLRYYLIGILLGGLIQSNSVKDFSKEFRRFVIETVRGYINEKNIIDYTNISIDDVLDKAESRRIVGSGKKWEKRNGNQI